jgi:hypothetical protein
VVSCGTAVWRGAGATGGKQAIMALDGDGGARKWASEFHKKKWTSECGGGGRSRPDGREPLLTEIGWR